MLQSQLSDEEVTRQLAGDEQLVRLYRLAQQYEHSRSAEARAEFEAASQADAQNGANSQQVGRWGYVMWSVQIFRKFLWNCSPFQLSPASFARKLQQKLHQ